MPRSSTNAVDLTPEDWWLIANTLRQEATRLEEDAELGLRNGYTQNAAALMRDKTVTLRVLSAKLLKASKNGRK